MANFTVHSPVHTSHTQVNNHTILGAGGEISDFQHIQTLLNELSTDDYLVDDGISLAPQQVSLLCELGATGWQGSVLIDSWMFG